MKFVKYKKFTLNIILRHKGATRNQESLTGEINIAIQKRKIIKYRKSKKAEKRKLTGDINWIPSLKVLFFINNCEYFKEIFEKKTPILK